MSNIWHLTGQAYCALSRSPEKVTEATLLSESAFIQALAVSPGLQKAIKRSNQETRQAVRALIGALHPFNLKPYLQESTGTPTLPAVVQLGKGIAPQALYLLCEQFGPEVVEKHIRYAYSREGYKKACGQGRIDSNIFLERKVFPLVEGEVISEAVFKGAHYTRAAEELVTILATLDDVPTEATVLRRQQELSVEAEQAAVDAHLAQDKAREAAEDTRQTSLKVIAVEKGNIDRLALDVRIDVEKAESDLQDKLKNFEKQLQIEVRKYGVAKYRDVINDHKQFLAYIKDITSEWVVTMQTALISDVDAMLGEEFIARALAEPFKSAQARKNWFNTKIKPFDLPSFKSKGYREESSHESRVLTGLNELFTQADASSLAQFFRPSPKIFKGLTHPTFVFLPYSIASMKTIIEQDVDPSQLPAPQVNIGVTWTPTTATDTQVLILASAGSPSLKVASGEIPLFKVEQWGQENIERAAFYVRKYLLEYYLKNVFPILEKKTWTYVVTLKQQQQRGYEGRLVRSIQDINPQLLPSASSHEEFQELAETAPFKLVWEGEFWTDRIKLPESDGEFLLDNRLDEFFGAAALSIGGAVTLSGIYHVIRYCTTFVKWVFGNLSYLFVKMVFTFTWQLTPQCMGALAKWYVNSVEKKAFDPIRDFYLAASTMRGLNVHDFTGTNSGFTVVQEVDTVPSYTFKQARVPISSELKKLELNDANDTLKAGWKVEILYFVPCAVPYWVIRRSVLAPGVFRKKVQTLQHLYYRLMNEKFLYATGASEKAVVDSFRKSYQSIFTKHEDIQGLVKLLGASGHEKEAQEIAGENAIDLETLDAQLESIENIDAELDKGLLEQDGETEPLAPPPSNATGSDAPTTDYQTTPAEYGDSPKPGDYQTASGAIIPKAEVQQMVGNVLKKVGDQIQQGATETGEEDPEEPIEEPADKSAVSEPPEQPEAPTEPEEPTEVPEEEEETAPEEPEGEPTKPKTTPTKPEAGEKKPEDEEETEDDAEETEDEEEETEKAKKKKQNEAVEINFRRLYGVRKSLAEFEVSAQRSRWYPFQTLHPLTEAVLNNDTIMQQLVLGIQGKRKAVREACAAFSSTHYSLKDLGFALGQANSLGSVGHLLLTETDDEDMEVLKSTPPEEEIIIPSPEEEEVTLAMSDTEAEMADKKLDYVDTTIDPTADEVSATTAEVVKDEVAQEFIRNGDTEATLARTQEISPELPDEEAKEVVFNIQNTTPVETPELPEPELPEMPIPDEDIIDTDPVDVLPLDAVESPPAVEINYGVNDENEMAYEGVLLKRDGMICEVATSDGRVKISASRVRLLPAASDLSACLQLMKRGVSPKILAERRLMSRVLGKPVDKLPRFRLDEDADYLVLYFKKEPTLCVESYGGYRDGNAAVIPVVNLSKAKRRQLVERLGRDSAYLVKSRTKILCNPYRSISEQLDVPEGDEGNTAAKSFEDAMALLQVARKALVDFEGMSGKIKSLVTLNDSGKKTATELEALSKEVKDAVKELGEVMEQFSKTHDTFSKEFPDAKAEEEVTDDVEGAPAEETPVEPEPEVEPSAEPEPAEPAPVEPSAQAPPTEGEKESQAVAESLLTKYPIGAFVANSDFGRIGKLILQENRYLTPRQIARVVEIIKESVGL
jgi:hypothetical protein